MKKLMNFIMLLAILNLITAAGLIAFLFATGRLNGEKTRTIVDLVRHQGAPANLREQVYDILEPAATTSRPASQSGSLPGHLANENPASSAEDRLTFARQAMEEERIALEAQAQDLRHRQDLLVKMQSDVQDKLTKIDAAKKDSQPKAATAQDKIKEENFQKTLSLYDELKPKQLREIFTAGKDPEGTAAYIGAMDPSRAAKIIAEFKTDDEKKFLADVLDKIKNAGTSAASGTPAAKEIAAASAGNVAAPQP